MKYSKPKLSRKAVGDKMITSLSAEIVGTHWAKSKTTAPASKKIKCPVPS